MPINLCAARSVFPCRDRHCRALAVLAAAIVALLAVSTAHAHAGLEESIPAANAVVDEPPDAVTMRFTEPLEWSGTTAEIFDRSGTAVAGTEVREGSDEYEMVLVVPNNLPDGTYSVLWRTLSTADGHPAQNYFAFTVGTDADVTEAATVDLADSGQPPLWLQSIARWLALLGLAAVLAVWPAWMLVIRPAAGATREVGEHALEHIRRYAIIALGVALAGNLVALGVQAALLPDGFSLDAVWTTLVDTRYGTYWLVRLGLLATLATVLRLVSWRSPRTRPIPALMGLVLSGGLVLPFSFVAHASAQTQGRAIALLADVLHLLGAALWTGGLFAIGAVLLPAVRRLPAIERRASLSTALRRFSTLALIAWATMVLTGIYSAWLHVGNLQALRVTDYGATLLTKLALLVPTLALAAINQRAVMPSLERFARMPSKITVWHRRFALSLAGEIALVIVVLATVGALTAQAPSRGAETTDTQPARTELSGGEREATLEISPGAPGPNRITVTLGGDALEHDTELLLRVSSAAQDTGEKELALSHDRGNTYSYEGSELSLAGAWSLELIVRPADAFEWRAYGKVTLASGSDDAASAPWVLASAPAGIGMALVLGSVTAAICWWRHPGIRRDFPLLASGIVALLAGAVLLWISRETTVTTIASVLSVLRRGRVPAVARPSRSGQAAYQLRINLEKAERKEGNRHGCAVLWMRDCRAGERDATSLWARDDSTDSLLPGKDLPCARHPVTPSHVVGSSP